jgi:hypothetical protein
MDGVRVPAGVAAMPPGRELAGILADLDPAAVANADTVVLMQAWARQLAHAQARFVDAVAQVGRATPFSGSDGERPSMAESPQRRQAAGEWAAGELAAAMRWTHRHAERELGFCEELVGLPAVFAALDAGALDRGRAWTFTDVLGTAELTAEQVARICATLVAPAARWTTGQLRARLLRMILEIDPGYAERRYRAAVRDRGVVGYLARDGSGTVSGQGLAAEEAVAACERLDALADAVRRAGHPGPVHQIRADLFTRLLDGRFQGMTHDQMIAALLADAAAADVADAADAPTAGTVHSTVTGPTTAERPICDGPTGYSPTEDTRGSEAAATGSAESATDDAAAGEDVATEAALGTARLSTVDSDRADRTCSGGEIRVGLATLMHRDERPGEVPGWGPVLAGVARTMVADRRGAEWRFAVTDAEGYLLFAGVTRRRPRPVREGGGGVVELQVPAALLTALVADAAGAGEWAEVLADVARQFANRAEHQAVLSRHPDDRFARAALRRHVQVRDRRCVAPGCRRSARRCQLDHTIDHALGGDTVPENSGPLCLRHHLMKHEGGWRLEQIGSGIFRWTSPLGQVYRSRGEPICPPEGPLHPRPVEPDARWAPARADDGPIMSRPPPPRPASPPRPRPSDDEPPPF